MREKEKKREKKRERFICIKKAEKKIYRKYIENIYTLSGN